MVDLFRRGYNGTLRSGEVARGVETAGDAMDEEPLDRPDPSRAPSPQVSSELRDEDGNATLVEILSILGCREEEPEGANGCDCSMVCPAPWCGLTVAVSSCVVIVLKRAMMAEMCW